MGYNCEKHGHLKTAWCDKCKKICKCDCKDRTFTKFSYLTYSCEDGEKKVIVTIHHCVICGEINHVTTEPYKDDQNRNTHKI